MAYEFDIDTDHEPPFTDNVGVEIVEFALGQDLDADILVVMSVMLVPVGDPKAHDLRFGIREKTMSSDWKISAPDYTMEAVDRYIPKEWRAFVRIQLGRAVRSLVGQILPEKITMETFYAGLEAKALTKYNVISRAVHTCGYETADEFRDPATNKDHWLFTKQV